MLDVENKILKVKESYNFTCEENEFCKQIKRTQNGKAFDDDQIQLIVESIRKVLNFTSSDNLLDLCCGNGHLAHFFFSEINMYHGVDFSEKLIGVAKKFFEKEPEFTFQVKEIVEFSQCPVLTPYTVLKHEDFNKALLYGSVAYLTPAEVKILLKNIYKNFCNIKKLYIAPIPNKEKAKEFFDKRGKDVRFEKLDDASSSIGYWYLPDEFIKISQESGWRAEIIFSDPKQCQAFYRFNILLTR